MSLDSISLDVEPPPVCPHCGEVTTAATVRTTFWFDEGPVIVEDIPAHVCGSCMEQFYDDDVGDALRRLAETGFPREEAAAHISVPVFSLSGRIRRRGRLPDECDLDYREGVRRRS
jgi:YgiT-type zinc finger domain-containing protein